MAGGSFRVHSRFVHRLFPYHSETVRGQSMNAPGIDSRFFILFIHGVAGAAAAGRARLCPLASAGGSFSVYSRFIYGLISVYSRFILKFYDYCGLTGSRGRCCGCWTRATRRGAPATLRSRLR